MASDNLRDWLITELELPISEIGRRLVINDHRMVTATIVS